MIISGKMGAELSWDSWHLIFCMRITSMFCCRIHVNKPLRSAK